VRIPSVATKSPGAKVSMKRPTKKKINKLKPKHAKPKSKEHYLEVFDPLPSHAY